MKKLSLLIAALLLASFFSFAQNQLKDSQLQWGQEKKTSMTEGLLPLKIIGCDSRYVFAHYLPWNYIYGDIYSEKLIRCDLKSGDIETLEYNLKTDGSEREYEFATSWEDKIYFFSSFQNKKHKKHYLFVQTINKNNFSLNSDLKKIAELDYEGESKRRPATFNYEFSPDSSKILIHYVLTNKDNEILRSGFEVFDENFELIWKNENISSNVGGYFLFQRSAVDNSGNVFFAGKAYNNKKEYQKEEENNQYFVVIYPKNQKKPVPIAVTLPENKYPISAQIGVDNNSNLVCAGVYSQTGMTNAVGIFSTKINIDEQKTSEIKTKGFDYNFLTKGMDEGEIEDLKKNMKKGSDFEEYEYNLRNIHFGTNETFALVIEKLRRTVSIMRDRTGETRTYHSYEGDIIVANFENTDASVKWMQKIPRDIHLVNDHRIAGSFGLAYMKDNSTQIIYNTMREGKLTGQGKAKDSELVLISIDENGKESGKKIHSAKSNKTVLKPANIGQLPSGEVVIFGLKGYSKLNFLKIGLNN